MVILLMFVFLCDVYFLWIFYVFVFISGLFVENKFFVVNCLDVWYLYWNFNKRVILYNVIVVLLVLEKIKWCDYVGVLS